MFSFQVRVSEQRVVVLEEEREVWSAAVSTSKYGLGEESGSHKTPRGKHVVREKIGEGAELGTIFKGRRPTGTIWKEGSEEEKEEDLILTRILWLDGIEECNKSSYERYIYFHGTNHEKKLGNPASIGCIRLGNKEMATLFEYAKIGTSVEIIE